MKDKIYVNTAVADKIARGVVKNIVDGIRIGYYTDLFTSDDITNIIREMIISDYIDKDKLYNTIYDIVLTDIKYREVSIYVLVALFDNIKWYSSIKGIVEKYVYENNHKLKVSIKLINSIVDNYDTMDNELARATIEYINKNIEESGE